MRENLECKLLAYANSDAYAFHMPGHKRLLDPIREYAENKSWCVASANSEIVAFPADNQKRGKLRKTGRDENGKFGCVMEDEAAANRLLQLDITEIDGFDNLHDAQGILRDEMKLAAEMYGARETLFSVNGSTCALLAAISAAVPKGGTILIERRSHMAVYHAAYLRDIDVAYVEDAGWDEAVANSHSENASVLIGIRGVSVRAGDKFRSPETVSGGLDVVDNGAGQRPVGESGATGFGAGQRPAGESGALSFGSEKRVDAVVITSPTYEGCMKDVAGWAEAAHANGAVLIVDEAHGAHLGFHPYFPKSAVQCGADLVIQSTHKTLPAMTQTALLHNVTGRVPTRKLQFFMDIYETSSPSYVLMASITASLRLVRERGEEVFAAYTDRLRYVRRELCSLKHFRLAGGEDAVLAFDNELPPYKAGTRMDPGKLVLMPRYRDEKAFGAAGLYDELRDGYHLQMEMRTDSYCLAMTSIADSDEGFGRLIAAMREIDERAEKDSQGRGRRKRKENGHREAEEGYRKRKENGNRESEEGCGKRKENGNCEAEEPGEGQYKADCKMQAENGSKESGCEKHLQLEPYFGCLKGWDGTDADAGIVAKVPVVRSESGGGMKISEALDAPSEVVDLADAAGRICADFVILYPPDVPLVAPGEVYTEAKVAEILGWIERGFSVMGVE